MASSSSSSLRRALCARSLLLRSSHRSVSQLPRLLSPSTSPDFNSGFLHNITPRSVPLDAPAFASLTGGWRSFAKGRKSKVIDEDDDDDDGDTAQVTPDIVPTVRSTAVSQMEAAIDALSRELNKLRTGRASAGILDHIIVDLHGAKMPLNHVAAVSVLDAKTLSVTPYDQSALKPIQTAIISSPLGLNPTDDGQRLLAVIPPLTKENMQALNKVVGKHSEDVKQSIRRARQKALDMIKKAKLSISKDDVKRLEKEVEDITKRFVKSAEDMCKAKEKEILGK